jgi:hypothetical protein
MLAKCVIGVDCQRIPYVYWISYFCLDIFKLIRLTHIIKVLSNIIRSV